MSVIQAIISNDLVRWRILEAVRSLGLPDCWIGAGFVRNAVWDYLHGYRSSPVSTDVDVIWFDAGRCSQEEDEVLESMLGRLDPAIMWSVKNQARMHVRNGDQPYLSATDAMRYWAETATAVAVRIGEQTACEVAAPLGLEDLFGLVIRPAGRFATEKRKIYQDRLKAKNWMATWPLLKCD
ncbi:nucleotidyltransferase family protein [Pseudomonas sp. KNUC1026]|uniref:nucleotidyltransferase family protein n=1 Tax=Pseudomonas sp. KNUC1026 TaxID=2893890 RepID=UPI003FA734F1